MMLDNNMGMGGGRQSANRFRPVKPRQPQAASGISISSGARPTLLQPQGHDLAFEDPNNVNGLYGRSAGTSVAFNAAARQRPGGGMVATPGLVKPVAPMGVPAQPQGQDGNLRADVYTPGGDPRLSGAQDRTDAAQRGVQGAPGYADETMGLNDRFRSVLSGGQSRYDAARGLLENLDARQGDARKKGIRDIGQAAASLGRLGSGMVTTDLGNLEDRLNTERERSLRDLSAQTTEGDINDRFRTLDLGMQGAGANMNDRYRRLDAAQGYEGGVYGQGASNRDEFRTERSYQTNEGQRSIENRIRQRELQNAEMNDRLRRGALQSQYGNAGTPSLEEILRAQYAGG